MRQLDIFSKTPLVSLFVTADRPRTNLLLGLIYFIMGPTFIELWVIFLNDPRVFLGLLGIFGDSKNKKNCFTGVWTRPKITKS